MTARPWMPLYIGDYLADTSHLTATEHGAYLLLLMHQWQRGSLPPDDELLIRIARVHPPHWPRVKRVLISFFETQEDGFWRNKRLAAERDKATVLSQKRATAAKQKHSNSSAIAPTNADAIAEQKHTHARGLLQPHPQKEGTPARESTSLHTAGFEKKPAAGRKANGQAAGSRYPAWFEVIWAAYRPIASPNSSKSRALTAAKRLSETDREACRAGLVGYVAWLRKARGKRGDYPAQHLATFINGRGWEAFSTQDGPPLPPPVSDAELQRIVDTINAEREREEQADDLAH